MSDIRLIITYDDDGSLKVLAKEAEDEGKKAGKKAGSSFSKEFSKFNKDAGAGITSALGTAAKSVTAIAAGVAAIGAATLFKGIGAATIQEDAVNRLAGALKSAGDFSQSTLQDFQNFASELQQVSKIGDEVALNQLALAKSFGATNDQAKQIVTTAADLAQAFGTDIETQVRQISKTLGGFAGELGETQPALKALTQEQLRNGEAIGILAEAYEGQAANALNTFGGATAQLSNQIGDTLEEIGKLVTQNPAVIKALKSLTGLFKEAGNEVAEFAKTFDIFDDLLIPLTTFNDYVITYLIAPLELVGNIGNIVFNTLKAGIATIVAGFGQLGQVIVKVLDTVGVDVDDKLKESIDNFAAAAKETSDEAGGDVRDSLEKIFDFNASDTLSKKNEDLRTFFQEQRDIIAQETEATNTQLDEGNKQRAEKITREFQSQADIYKAIGDSVVSSSIETVNGVQKQVEQANKVIGKFAKNTGQSLQRGIGQASGAAFAELGRALQAGENGLEAFGKTFLKAIGNVLIQQGTAFILEGTAYTFSTNPELTAKGPGLIAAGAAMATFGGILGASVGGQSTAGGGGVGGPTVGGSTDFGGDTIDEGFVGELEQTAQAQTVLNINVEGNVVDQDAFTRRLVEQIGEEGGRQGLVFNNFQTV